MPEPVLCKGCRPRTQLSHIFHALTEQTRTNDVIRRHCTLKSRLEREHKNIFQVIVSPKIMYTSTFLLHVVRGKVLLSQVGRWHTPPPGQVGGVICLPSQVGKWLAPFPPMARTGLAWSASLEWGVDHGRYCLVSVNGKLSFTTIKLVHLMFCHTNLSTGQLGVWCIYYETEFLKNISATLPVKICTYFIRHSVNALRWFQWDRMNVELWSVLNVRHHEVKLAFINLQLTKSINYSSKCCVLNKCAFSTCVP